MASVQSGFPGYLAGSIADQLQLLQDIKDGLQVYNASPNAALVRHAGTTIREVTRISQTPLKFNKMADGGNAENSRQSFRLISTPLENFDLSPEFTLLWLQDALPSDVDATVKGALTGDAQLMDAKFFECLLTKRTAGAVGTAYRASFYNGETDVPAYKNSTFASAHYHYLGLNATTFTLSHLRAMKRDIQEHGFGLQAGDLHMYINNAQEDDVMALINSNSTILQAITGQRERAIDGGLRNSGFDIIIEGVVIHVDDNVPSGYLTMVASDAEAVLQRTHINPAYQGLQQFRESPNEMYPLMGMKFVRRTGFSASNLGAATSRQLVASTTYTNPTFNQLS